MTGTDAQFRQVKALTESGLSDYRISELTHVPRATVLRWRKRDSPLIKPDRVPARSWLVNDQPVYCYLLGCYLGDGHVTHKPPRSWTLRVACDRRYESIIEEVRAAMSATFPGRDPTRRAASVGASDVIAITHPGVGQAFPQHGPGRKHLRPIVLADWQLALTRSHPGALIRGLVHSDGCRTENRFRTKLPSGRTAEYSYIRYFFSNLSADIRQIFIDHCELLGVRVTQSNHRNLSVSHRNSVAVLERIIGPKT
jgi:hypothetical protein